MTPPTTVPMPTIRPITVDMERAGTLSEGIVAKNNVAAPAGAHPIHTRRAKTATGPE